MEQNLQYPIGRFTLDGGITAAQVQAWTEDVARIPAALRRAIAGLTEEQLDTPYRPGGWTVRQVVHHLADAHLNNYVRWRLALTEEQPAPPAWNDKRWAELHDARHGPVEVSLVLLESVHQRWEILLRSMSPQDFARCFQHPARGMLALDCDLGLYVWHGWHHIAHITSLRERMGW